MRFCSENDFIHKCLLKLSYCGSQKMPFPCFNKGKGVPNLISSITIQFVIFLGKVISPPFDIRNVDVPN